MIYGYDVTATASQNKAEQSESTIGNSSIVEESSERLLKSLREKMNL